LVFFPLGSDPRVKFRFYTQLKPTLQFYTGPLPCWFRFHWFQNLYPVPVRLFGTETRTAGSYPAQVGARPTLVDTSVGWVSDLAVLETRILVRKIQFGFGSNFWNWELKSSLKLDPVLESEPNPNLILEPKLKLGFLK
jgi:hypothetical protein